MGCHTPDICGGPVPCDAGAVLTKACCSCVVFPDCDIDDDDNGGDPFCPAECLVGYIRPGDDDDDDFDPDGGVGPDGFGGDCGDPPKPPPGPPIPPRPDPGDIEPSGPRGDITYWVCTQNQLCIPITQSRDLPIPPGAWRTEAECAANCGGPVDPGDPGGGDITYWICTQINPWSKKCLPITQARDLPPPPGSWATLAECKANCDSGPGGPGGGGGDPIPPGGIPPRGGPGVQKACACIMAKTPFISGTAYDCPTCPPGCRIMTAEWAQTCKPVPLTGPPSEPKSLAELRESHKGEQCYTLNQGDVQNDCKDWTITSNQDPCTDPNKKCVPIKLTWCECRPDATGPIGPSGPSGPQPPVPPGGGLFWRCVNSLGVFSCIQSTHFGALEIKYPTKALCLANCIKTPPPPPPPPPGEPAWRCVDTGGVKGCIYTNKFGPGETRHATKLACQQVCTDGGSAPPAPGPSVPPPPEPPGLGPAWRCVDSGGVKSCIWTTHFGPLETRYPTKAACKANCIDSGGGDLGDPIGGDIIDGGGGGGGSLGDPIGGDLFDDEGNPLFGSPEMLTIDNLKLSDKSLDPYDDEYNIRISNDPFRAKLANRTIQKGILDNNNLFKDSINQSLDTFLRTTSDGNVVPYNGTTLSTFIYQEGIIQNSLTPSIKQLINRLNTFNMAALDLTQMMYRALKRAAYTNTYEGYTPQLLQELISSSDQLSEPIPILYNQNVPSSNRELGLTRVRNSRRSMYAKKTSNGDLQRRVQSYHMLPSDYNLKIPVYTRSGISGIRVGNDDAIDVVAWSGVHAKVGEKNDYLTVGLRNRGPGARVEVGVSLKSKRSKAQAFNLPDLSIIQGYLKRGNKGERTSDPKYSFNLSVSTSYADNVELSSGTALKAGYLVKLAPSSIGSIKEEIVNFRQTSAVYVSAWEEGDDDVLFNAAVSAHSGPRNTVYIEAGDPWWNHFLKTRTLTATYLDLDIDGFDDYIYPRRVNVDMLLVPIEKIDYNLLQGESELTKYTSEGVVRDLRMMISPLSRVFNSGYISPTKKPDERGWDNKGDTWATMYTKDFNEVLVKQEVLTSEDPSTNQSILGRFLSKIDEIKEAYNIESSPGIEAIPQSDLFSFFTVDEVAQYLFSVPPQIRNKLFAGAYNNIEIINILDVDVEKTYISSDRLLSGQTSLESSRYYTKVPNLDSHYFENKYEGILFTYASRT